VSENGVEEFIPGEVVLALGSGSGDAPPAFVYELPVYAPEGLVVERPAPARSGLVGLDAVLDQIGARALYRVFEPGGGPALDAVVVVRFDRARSVEEVMAALLAVPEVLDASRHARVSAAVVPNDPFFAQQWGLTKIRCDRAWDYTTGDANERVAVCDTGCDYNHSDLGARSLAGRNFIDSRLTAQDDNGHGTHVAGTVAAVTDNGVDVAGVMWRSQVLPVKVLDSKGSGPGAVIAAGIVWAVDSPQDAKIVNCSLTTKTDDLAIRRAVREAGVRGALVVAAMGNQGSGPDSPSYPAGYAHGRNWVVAVGATNRDNVRWPLSNRGPWITVVAPGVDILSTKLGGGVESRTGTSMATPHVSGVAGLIKALAPDATATDLKSQLALTALPIRDHPDDPVPNDAYGAGLLDAQNALAQFTVTVQRLGPTDQLYTTPPGCGAQRAVPSPNVYIGSAPALAMFDGRLYLAFQAVNRSLTLHVSTLNADGRTFPPATPSPDVQIGSAPALAFFNDKLYVAFQAANDSHTLHVSTLNDDGITFPRATPSPDVQIGSAPALAVFNNKLYVAFQANDDSHTLFVSTLNDDGITFPQATPSPNVKIGSAPALAAFRNTLYVAFQADDDSGTLHASRLNDDGITFPSATPSPDVQVGTTPALASLDNKLLYVAFRSTDGSYSLMVSRLDDGLKFPTATESPSVDLWFGPAMAIHSPIAAARHSS
jgi:subtilisin family serine protease